MGKKLLLVFFIVFLIIVIPGVRVPTPRNLKLADCNEANVKFDFECPEGENYCFVFGMSTIQRFTGVITIYHKGAEIHKFPFDSEKFTRGNWLDMEGQAAYIIGEEPNSFERFDDHIKKNENYEVEIQFDELPPEGTSFWLHYLAEIGMFTRG